jgi:sugar lactone lactonase YvrE
MAFSPDGKLLATYRVQLPNEVDVRDGKIAVAAANGVAVFTADDRILAQFGTRGRGEDQFDLPHGIALAQDGNIYVSDTHNRRVRAYTPSGRLIWSLGEGARGDNKDWRSVETSGTFELPAGMTIDGAGRIVLVDPFKFEIIAVDAKTGKVARADGKLARYGDFGQADGMFNFPTGIAYDRTRDWFVVADTQNNRLQIVRLPGSGGSIVAPLMSSFSPPMLVCFLPLLLLLIAAIVMVMRRRRELMSEQPGEPGSTPAA